ncbi:MAG: hypothetical protein U1A27_09690 [Phycisphaerae bacterium]
MNTREVWCGAAVGERFEVEIDRATVDAFWRLGRALEAGAPRDREVFTLGRCIGGTTGVTAVLFAHGERDDPAAFAMSKLMYGGDQPMLDAYWQSPDDPVVFRLARAVYRAAPQAKLGASGDREEGGAVIFDVSGEQARLAGVRFPVEL